jgi:hypothetical protein
MFGRNILPASIGDGDGGFIQNVSGLHSIISQKIVLIIATMVRISDPTRQNTVYTITSFSKIRFSTLILYCDFTCWPQPFFIKIWIF